MHLIFGCLTYSEQVIARAINATSQCKPALLRRKSTATFAGGAKGSERQLLAAGTNLRADAPGRQAERRLSSPSCPRHALGKARGRLITFRSRSARAARR